MDNLDYKKFKIFSKYYVGVVDGEPPLGFATPYEDNKACRERIETIDRWRNGSKSKSFIFDNIPVKGFAISKSIKRIYWGGGNVVWRVYDPRGFELEISSSNLARIIDSVGLSAGGVIENNCIWGRLDGSNILIPEGSELWGKQIDSNKTTKNYNIGDLIVLKNGKTFVYGGKINALMYVMDEKKKDELGYSRGYNRGYDISFTLETAKFHVMMDSNGKVAEFRKEISVNSVEKTNYMSVADIDASIKKYNNLKKYERLHFNNNYNKNIIFISCDKIESYYFEASELSKDKWIKYLTCKEKSFSLFFKIQDNKTIRYDLESYYRDGKEYDKDKDIYRIKYHTTLNEFRKDKITMDCHSYIDVSFSGDVKVYEHFVVINDNIKKELW